LTSAAPRAAQASAPSAARLIINPLSFRMSRGQRHGQLVSLARELGLEVVTIADEAALDRAIRAVVEAPPARLIICAGDGTVQALVTALADLDESQRPELLVLGGGRTNYTALDLGTQRKPEQLLRRAADPEVNWQQVVRHSLIIRQDGQPDRHGFFIAGALVDDIIRDCHRYRQRHRHAALRWLRTGHLSSLWRVSQLGLLRLLGRRSFPAHPMSIDAAGLGSIEGDVRLLVMTTLAHRSQLVDPYADRGQGALRLTATTRGAAGFWRRLPRLLRGRYHRAMSPTQGYLSGRCDRARLTGLEAVCLDGQEHDYRRDRRLEVLTGPNFRFLQP
jgi:hypothetical protein